MHRRAAGAADGCSMTSGPSTLIKDHLAGGASRPAALLLPQILPVSSVVAPCRPGAALEIRCTIDADRPLMARKTSFYYSFLVLPAEQRRAIVAVWDFCRAVDDAVDEESSAARARGLSTVRSIWGSRCN